MSERGKSGTRASGRYGLGVKRKPAISALTTSVREKASVLIAAVNVHELSVREEACTVPVAALIIRRRVKGHQASLRLGVGSRKDNSRRGDGSGWVRLDERDFLGITINVKCSGGERGGERKEEREIDEWRNLR